jgi:hypothetical protein
VLKAVEIGRKDFTVVYALTGLQIGLGDRIEPVSLNPASSLRSGAEACRLIGDISFGINENAA